MITLDRVRAWCVNTRFVDREGEILAACEALEQGTPQDRYLDKHAVTCIMKPSEKDDGKLAERPRESLDHDTAI